MVILVIVEVVSLWVHDLFQQFSIFQDIYIILYPMNNDRFWLTRGWLSGLQAFSKTFIAQWGMLCRGERYIGKLYLAMQTNQCLGGLSWLNSWPQSLREVLLNFHSIMSIYMGVS